jgi:gliding motility-associated-like protein
MPLVLLEPQYVWCPGDQFTLDASQPFDATYFWNTGAITSSIQVDTPGLYTVDVFTHCFEDSGQSDIIPDEDCPTGPVFYIPNVFSPDGDGINDEFTAFTDLPSNVISMRGTIFDRWGNLLYSSAENPFTWNGNLNDEPMNPGVYVYVIHIRYLALAGEEEVVFSGDVTLVR